MNKALKLIFLEAKQSAMLTHTAEGFPVVCMEPQLWKRLREAMEDAMAPQPAQQEPVGYAVPTFDFDNSVIKTVHYAGTVPLYTSPPQENTWVGLTDEDKETLILKHAPPIHPDYQDDSMDELIDMVEAKLKEKNNG